MEDVDNHLVAAKDEFGGGYESTEMLEEVPSLISSPPSWKIPGLAGGT